MIAVSDEVVTDIPEQAETLVKHFVKEMLTFHQRLVKIKMSYFLNKFTDPLNCTNPRMIPVREMKHWNPSERNCGRDQLSLQMSSGGF